MSPDVTPRCAAHPEEPAAATCQRCGGFVCTACSTWVLSALYCPTCAVRPEVNYLESFRLTLWGRRDASTYLVGAGTLGLAAGGVTAFLEGYWQAGLALLAAAAVGGAFFLGRRWARFALLFTPLAGGFFAAPFIGLAAIVLFLIPSLYALQIFLDPRNRLFFRMEIPEKDLLRLWNLHANNPLARHAMALGVGSIFMPLAAPLAIILGFIALRRVDLQARPPIGRQGQAVLGIVLALASVAAWALLFWPRITGAVTGLAER